MNSFAGIDFPLCLSTGTPRHKQINSQANDNSFSRLIRPSWNGFLKRKLSWKLQSFLSYSFRKSLNSWIIYFNLFCRWIFAGKVELHQPVGFWTVIIVNSRSEATMISRVFVRILRKRRSSDGSRLRTALRASCESGPMNLFNSTVCSASKVDFTDEPERKFHEIWFSTKFDLRTIFVENQNPFDAFRLHNSLHSCFEVCLKVQNLSWRCFRVYSVSHHDFAETFLRNFRKTFHKR